MKFSHSTGLKTSVQKTYFLWLMVLIFLSVHCQKNPELGESQQLRWI